MSKISSLKRYEALKSWWDFFNRKRKYKPKKKIINEDLFGPYKH